MRKRIVCAALALCMLLGLCGCGAEEEAPPVAELGAAMLAADAGFPEMKTVESDASLFANVSDVDYGKVEAYYLAYSADGLADEIVLVRMKKNRDTAAMKESLEKHRDGRIRLYRNYKASEAARAEAGIVFVSGRDVALVISDARGAVRKAYEETRG